MLISHRTEVSVQGGACVHLWTCAVMMGVVPAKQRGKASLEQEPARHWSEK